MMANVGWLVVAVCSLPVMCVAQKSGGLLSCYQCVGNAPHCSTTCMGRYCYKSELEVSGEKTLKTGCLNSTDSRAAPGDCSVRKGTLPGGGSETTERFCVCDKAKCNTAGMVRPCSRSLMTMLVAIYATLTVVRQL